MLMFAITIHTPTTRFHSVYKHEVSAGSHQWQTLLLSTSINHNIQSGCFLLAYMVFVPGKQVTTLSLHMW